MTPTAKCRLGVRPVPLATCMAPGGHVVGALSEPHTFSVPKSSDACQKAIPTPNLLPYGTIGIPVRRSSSSARRTTEACIGMIISAVFSSEQPCLYV